VGFEAGRDRFWLAGSLQTRGIEAYDQPTSIPVSPNIGEQRPAGWGIADAGGSRWLRGEPKHYNMAAIPTIAEEDARRPNREHHFDGRADSCCEPREGGVGRSGIRNFNVKLRKAGGHLAALRGLEDEPPSPNTVAELRPRHGELRLIREQIKAFDEAGLERLKQAPRKRTQPMLLMLGQIMGVGIETAESWSTKCSRANCGINGP
jgi:transposase